MPQENLKTIIGEIVGYSHQGEGVAKIDNRVIFIKNALLDETVKAEITRQKKNVCWANLLEVIKPSPERREPSCRVFAKCGGCSLQNASYQEQLRIKEGILKNSLQRIGKLDITQQFRPMIGMEAPFYYRNKGVFRVILVDGNLRFGFQEENSHTIVKHSCKLLFSDNVSRFLYSLEAWLNQSTHQEIFFGLSRLMVRESRYSGEIMLILMGNETVAGEDRLLQQLYRELQEKHPGFSVFGYATDHGEANPIYNNLQMISKQMVITEQLNDTLYEISPASFFQVNSKQAAVMLSVIRDLLLADKKAERQIIFDMYCGIGTIGISLAKHADKLIGVEIVPQAVSDAKRNAMLNRLENADFLCGKAEKLFSGTLSQQEKHGQHTAITVIMDPPRKGCRPDFLQQLLEFMPDRILYVSCNPATLARDLQILCVSGEYRVDFMQPIDMFPQTWHCEVVCLLQRTER